MRSLNKYAEINEDGICFSTNSEPFEGAIKVGRNENVIGKKWNGEAFISVPPEPTVPSYNRGEFLEALGDTVVLKIMELAKTEPAYELLWEKFKARDEFVGDHPLLTNGLQALADDPRIPFDASKKAAICDPRT